MHMGLPIPSARDLVDGATSAEEAAVRGSLNKVAKSAREVADEFAEFTQEMTKATIAGLTGATQWDTAVDAAKGFVGTAQVAPIRNDYSRSAEVSKALNDFEMAKSTEGAAAAWDRMSKEWTLSTPISTGLVPFDLEAPAKLLTPRPTPLRNSIPRIKGQGSSRRFKVISGFTGTGTGGITTTQPGVTESTTNVGPGGLNYIRGPYISYAGYDVNLSYVTTSLSDSVSWQAEYQGMGFEDIRSLSNTALLYATMLLDERLMIYGRGTTGNGYAGALGTPGSVTLSAVSASVAPGGSSTLGSGTAWVVVAADAGDLLGTNGTAMHQGPSTSAASVSVSAGQAIQVTVGTDVAGALGYNLYVGSVSSGPFYYAGRTGYNVGYVTSQPSSGPTTTSGATDQSAVATNYDGLLTNVAASGGYNTRLNAPFSTTNPGAEYQVAFGSLYESVKADPQEIWMNGFDRLQLSNAIINNAANSAYRVFIPNSDMGGVKAGTVVQTLMNEVTGSEIPITVHPWFPQGNSLIRQKTLPIPDSNVSETSVMVLPQDYVAVQWPVVQFTYDASTFTIGTFCHYAPTWNGLIQGIQGVGIGVKPPSYGDS
jgi:hypothetical protein